jgi:hypothetical protein
MVVKEDSDILAYGARRLIIVNSWKDESFRTIDLDEAIKNNPDTQNTLIKVSANCSVL